VPSLATDAISDACKEIGMVVAIGVNERDGATLYNMSCSSTPTAR